MKNQKALLIVFAFILVFVNACDVIWKKTFSEPFDDLMENIPGFNPANDIDDDSNPPRRDNYYPSFPLQGSENPGRTGLAFAQKPGQSPQDAMKAIAQTGVSFVRVEFPEEYIQSSLTEYIFSTGDYEKQVIEAAGYGLRVIGLLTYGPRPGLYDQNDESAFLNLWGAYVQAVVDKFGKHINHWEIHNEQNSLQFWKKGRPQDSGVDVKLYAKMLDRAYKIIKGHDQNDIVIVGGLIADTDFTGGYPPTQFIKALSMTEAANSFDAIGLHPYWGDHWPELQRSVWRSSQAFLTLRDYMHEFIQDAKFYFKREVPIYITEMGLSSSWVHTLKNETDKDYDQMEWALVCRIFATLLSFPEVQAVIWFVYAPVSGGEDFAISKFTESQFNLITQTLDQAWPLGRFDVEDGSGNPVWDAYEYRFELANGTIVSWFWHIFDTYKQKGAFLEGAPEDVRWYFSSEKPFEHNAMPVDQDHPFPLGIMPGLLIGDIRDHMVVTLAGEKNHQSQGLSSPIVYKKGHSLWIYSPETQGKELLAFSDDWRHVMSDPKISLDGKYISYNNGQKDSFVIINRETGEEGTIQYRQSNQEPIGKPFGWDKDNVFYFLMNSGSEVYSYDPRRKEVTYRFDLPAETMEEHGSFYPIWISPSTRYLMFNKETNYEAYLWDRITQRLISIDDCFYIAGLFSMSIDENVLAVPKFDFEREKARIFIERLEDPSNNSFYMEDDTYSLESPVLSPDGTMIAFLRTNRGPNTTQENFSGVIQVAKITGNSFTVIKEIDGTGYYSWSPDGKQLAYTSHLTRSLYIVDIYEGNTAMPTLIDDGIELLPLEW